jgi:hypothetical protein
MLAFNVKYIVASNAVAAEMKLPLFVSMQCYLCLIEAHPLTLSYLQCYYYCEAHSRDCLMRSSAFLAAEMAQLKAGWLRENLNQCIIVGYLF